MIPDRILDEATIADGLADTCPDVRTAICLHTMARRLRVLAADAGDVVVFQPGPAVTHYGDKVVRGPWPARREAVR